MKMKKNNRFNKKPERISVDQYYLNIAKEVASRSTCIRRNYGAVIVNNDQIISTGYGGSPRGTRNCIDIGICVRKELDVPKGEHYEWCRAVHAEQNAIIHASRRDTIGSKLYLVGLDYETKEILTDGEPCKICKRMIINAGVETVVVLVGKNKIKEILVSKWVKESLGEIIKTPKGWKPTKPKGYGYTRY